MTQLETVFNEETAQADLNKENIENNENININGINIKNEKNINKRKGENYISNKNSKLSLSNNLKYCNEATINEIVSNSVDKKEVLNDLSNKGKQEELEIVNENTLNNKSFSTLPEKDNNDTINSDKKNKPKKEIVIDLIDLSNEQGINNNDNNNNILLKERSPKNSGEIEIRYSMRKRKRVNYKNSPVFTQKVTKNRTINNSMEKNTDSYDTPQNKEKTEENGKVKYSLRKRKTLNYKDVPQFYAIVSNDKSNKNNSKDIKKEIDIDTEDNIEKKVNSSKNEKVIKSNIEKDTLLASKSDNFEKEKIKIKKTSINSINNKTKPKRNSQRVEIKVRYKLRSRDKKSVPKKKNYLQPIRTTPSPKEKHVNVNKRKEIKAKRLKELSNEDTVNKIKEIFCTLPLFKENNGSDNEEYSDEEENEELSEELFSDENDELESKEEYEEEVILIDDDKIESDDESKEEKISIEDDKSDYEESVSLNDNTFDSDDNNSNQEQEKNLKSNRMQESSKLTILISNEKLDNMMEDNLYAYLSRNPNSKLKNIWIPLNI
ncbi:hypothetical protein PIROE2DRAFT_57140 [Piromyces sp. E2]|nr:hypothetical protein PIROE2DRAFT_57140 [Piromyces sp. E2]|eukprot:OUM69884.1 hypothetical protein PIROE2DRAFT_57140 [Piromyces sp. E2]